MKCLRETVGLVFALAHQEEDEHKAKEKFKN